MVNPVVFLNYWVMIEVIAATIIFPDFGETIPNPEMQVCIMEAVMENLGLIEISR